MVPAILIRCPLLVLCFHEICTDRLFWIVIIVSISVSSLLSFCGGIILPFNLDISILMTSVMLLSIKYKDIIITHHYNILYSFICLLCILSYIGILFLFDLKSINYYGNSLGIIPITIAVSLCGTYIVLWLSHVICEKFSNAALKPILWIGRNSIVFLIIHQTCIIHPLNMYNLLIDYPIISGVIRFIIIIGFCTISVPVINSYLKKTIC